MVILIVAIGMTSSCTSRQNVAIDHKDSVEYAVYASKPLNYPEDCDPLYIPIEMLGAYQPGDIALVDSNGMLVEFAPRDEFNHLDSAGLHQVKVQERLNYNKWFAK